MSLYGALSPSPSCRDACGREGNSHETTSSDALSLFYSRLERISAFERALPLSNKGLSVLQIVRLSPEGDEPKDR